MYSFTFFNLGPPYPKETKRKRINRENFSSPPSAACGWSMLADDGSSLSPCKKKRLESAFEGEKDEVSMGEKRGVGENRSLSRPLPPLLGNGKAIDLVKLFVHVKNRGGYEAVTREGLWETVGEDQGLSCAGLGAAIKLVYYKYLQSLERDSMNVSGSVDFDDMAMDFVGLKADLKAFASTVLDGEKKNDAESEEGSTDGDKLGGVKMGSTVENVEAADVDSASSGLSGNQKPPYADVDVKIMKNETKSVENEARSATKYRRSSGANGGEEQEAVVGDSFAVKEGSTQKRKRESLSCILQWMAFAAKDPTNPVIGSLPESSKWNSYAKDHSWKQVLLARKALFLKKPEGMSQEQYDLQKQQRMHPSMYDDVNVSAERVRARRLLQPSSLSQNFSFSNQSSSIFQKRIPVGKFFQVDVPKWTGLPAESDSKWLGTRIYPPDKSGPVSPLDQYSAPNIRRDPCGCQYPGSSACVKLHVSRSRMKLKVELGSIFYLWKFDKMGEEAAVSWTAKEEQKFEAVVKENPLSLGKFFWDELTKSLPMKNREELVSYYYNVFLLRRRGHQNRCSPSDIDSDDDETEFIAKSNSLILSPGKKTNAR
ncbi:hypothetical protein V2J09_002397 [Rumex salicifolius]